MWLFLSKDLYKSFTLQRINNASAKNGGDMMLGYIFLNDYKNHVKPHLGQFVLGFDPKFLQMQVR